MNPTRALLAAALSLTACYSESSYNGDGRLVDNGPSAATRRYIVELGRIDLSTRKTETFSLRGLPGEVFAIGLQVRSLVAPKLPLSQAKPIHAMLTMRLMNERHELVILEEAPLQDWTWSAPGGIGDYFVYRRGEQREIPLANGSVQLEQIGLKPDSGWGTYFTPRRSGDYRLTLGVLEPDPGAGSYMVIVEAHSGGWK